MNKVKVVTGYVPLPVINLTRAQFTALGERLLDSMVCPVKVFGGTVQSTWMYKHIEGLGVSVLPSDPEPATDRFLQPYDMMLSNCVMHQKMEWIALAALEDPEPDTFVWIDYGVMKQPDMSEEIVRNFLLRLKEAPLLTAITAPGIRGQEPINDRQSWDRFCGSLVMVPRSLLFQLARLMKQLAIAYVNQTRMVTIESNTLAHAEETGLLPFHWYQAWWGAAQFTNYRP